jgi:hypothetical protein
MPTPVDTLGESIWNLPPLILHPFNERVPPATLLENSKAALMLAGLIPGDGSDEEHLRRRLLAGRHAEIRMLFFVGKDVARWIEQCLECALRDAALESAGLAPQSFAELLTSRPPQTVKKKLERWGVVDHASVFARAIGLNAVFAEPPAFEGLAEEFLRNYHRYADAAFRCYMGIRPFLSVTAANFPFELYASGEYSRMLETQWGE